MIVFDGDSSSNKLLAVAPFSAPIEPVLLRLIRPRLSVVFEASGAGSVVGGPRE